MPGYPQGQPDAHHLCHQPGLRLGRAAGPEPGGRRLHHQALQHPGAAGPNPGGSPPGRRPCGARHPGGGGADPPPHPGDGVGGGQVGGADPERAEDSGLSHGPRRPDRLPGRPDRRPVGQPDLH